ncbi:MAG: hypothetical protein LBP59_10720 [Planctomycetaceae bacterium]|jgi:hypothetical protein|nr:hypothetical protein [Planctomycetaceae bacterium]
MVVFYLEFVQNPLIPCNFDAQLNGYKIGVIKQTAENCEFNVSFVVQLVESFSDFDSACKRFCEIIYHQLECFVKDGFTVIPNVRLTPPSVHLARLTCGQDHEFMKSITAEISTKF